MQNTTKKKWPAIVSAMVVVALIAIWVGILLLALGGNLSGDIVGIVFLGLYVTLAALVLLGVLAALRQRLREIDRGEEEDAKQY